jgi:DNA-directed RNA polymerase subunit RPC12/RpoP
MITCRGTAFAERMLTELNVDVHGYPPVCERCGRDFELWRSAAKKKGTPYFWRCNPCGSDRQI